MFEVIHPDLHAQFGANAPRPYDVVCGANSVDRARDDDVTQRRSDGVREDGHGEGLADHH